MLMLVLTCVFLVCVCVCEGENSCWLSGGKNTCLLLVGVGDWWAWDTGGRER